MGRRREEVQVGVQVKQSRKVSILFSGDGGGEEVFIDFP